MPLTIVTVLMLFYKSVDIPSRFREHPFTILRTPLHDSMDTLARFRRHPCTIPRISLAISRKNCGLPTRTICGFRKVSCDKYRMCLSNHLNLLCILHGDPVPLIVSLSRLCTRSMTWVSMTQGYEVGITVRHNGNVDILRLVCWCFHCNLQPNYTSV